MSSFPDAVDAIICARSSGLCEVCGASRATEQHHRRRKGAGGDRRPETHLAANGLNCCRQCHHQVIHANPNLAALLGWAIPSTFLPETQPVLRRGEWMYFENNGDMRSTVDDFAEYSPYRPTFDADVKSDLL